jgi:hypothetical protein
MRRSSMIMAMFESGLSRLLPGNTQSPALGFRNGATAFRTAEAASDSGTLCSARAFMRVAGTLQTAAFMSTSDHRAPMTSPVRAAVKIAKCEGRHSFLAPDLCHKRAISSHGREVLYYCDSGRRRQQLCKMPTPPCRVLCRAPAVRCCVVQHSLDTAPKPCCSLGLLAPNRLQHLYHVARGNWRDGASCQSKYGL